MEKQKMDQEKIEKDGKTAKSVVMNLMMAETSGTDSKPNSSDTVADGSEIDQMLDSPIIAKPSSNKICLDPRKRRMMPKSSESTPIVHSQARNSGQSSPQTTPLKIIQNKMLPKPAPFQAPILAQKDDKLSPVQPRLSQSVLSPKSAETKNYSSPIYTQKIPIFAPRTPTHTPSSPAYSTVTYSTNASLKESSSFHEPNRKLTENKSHENQTYPKSNAERNRERNQFGIYKMSEILRQQVNSQKVDGVYNQPYEYIATASSNKYMRDRGKKGNEAYDRIVNDLCNPDFSH